MKIIIKNNDRQLMLFKRKLKGLKKFQMKRLNKRNFKKKGIIEVKMLVFLKGF